MEYSQAEKEKFFAHLDSLGESEEDFDNSTQRLEELANKRRKLNRRPERPTLKRALTSPSNKTIAQQDVHPVPLARATTDVAATAKSLNRPLNSAESASSDIPVVQPFQRRSSNRRTKNNLRRGSNGDATEDGLGGKNSEKLLFDGLSFFFIPNNDVHPVRKRRIQSATAQGATWVRDPKSSITHIIVDADLSANDIVKFLNGAVELARVAVVKDKWLVESLTYKTIRDTTQGRFQLQGASDVLPKCEQTSKEATDLVQPVIAIGDQSTTTNEQVEEKLQPQPVKVTTHDETKPEPPPVKATDELAQILQEMQSTRYLPFDEELDLDDYVSFESTTPTKARDIPRENKGFQCMEANTGDDKNPNARTIEILQKMATYHDRTGDNWRTLAYRKAMTALRKQSHLVKTAKQAQSIKGIGSRLADKIEEIVTTNRLRRFESTLNDPSDQLLQSFTGIYGVGIQKARLWISEGYQSLEDLRSRAKLTTNQQIGLDHYDDFQQRIPRDEVAKHGRIVARALKEVNKDLEGIIGGSYRRGNKDSGDIDVIVTHPTAGLAQLRAWVFDNVVPDLMEIGFMKCALATSRHRGKESVYSPGSKRSKGDVATSSSLDTGSKFHGASALTPESPWRRIDLLLTPHTEIGAALIYFTGNDIFNRSMRLLASRKGMRLNQCGLYKDVMRLRDRTKVTDGELVEGRSEKKIFEILEVPWRPPYERKC